MYSFLHMYKEKNEEKGKCRKSAREKTRERTVKRAISHVHWSCFSHVNDSPVMGQLMTTRGVEGKAREGERIIKKKEREKERKREGNGRWQPRGSRAVVDPWKYSYALCATSLLSGLEVNERAPLSSSLGQPAAGTNLGVHRYAFGITYSCTHAPQGFRTKRTNAVSRCPAGFRSFRPSRHPLSHRPLPLLRPPKS